jgi:MarR family transcriptional regulator for hemolysin
MTSGEDPESETDGREIDYLDQWSSHYGEFYPPGSRLDREFRLSRMLVLAGRSWQHRIENILREETGQTRARWQALFGLGFAEQPATMGELCKRVRVRWPTMVRLLDGMERDGLVRREENPADGRSRLVYLTDKGEAMMRKIQPLLDSERTQVLRHLSDEEMELCTALLQRIFEDAINP